MTTFTDWINTLDSFVWGPAMLVLILGTGLYLQVRLGGMPVRKIGAGLRVVWSSRGGDEAHGEVSPYAALMTCLAATIGVGNIAGVATAVALGGPGAVFWMWMTALVGMATKYAEVLLAVHFRERDEKGRFVGGPMYAIRNGLGPRWAWLGTAFALFGGLAGFGIGNMVQSNSIAAAMQGSFGTTPLMTGIVLALITGAVILGGIKRIASVANWLVPFMAIGYVAAAMIVLAYHWQSIPGAFALHFLDSLHRYRGGRWLRRRGDDGCDPLRCGTRHLLERGRSRHGRHRAGSGHEQRSRSQRPDRHDGHVFRHPRGLHDDGSCNRGLGRLAVRQDGCRTHASRVPVGDAW